jgi:hypothetical protein
MTVQEESVRLDLDWSTPAAGSGREVTLGYDSLLIPETLRQAGIAVAHACCGVPASAQFIMADMRYSVAAVELLVGGDGTEALTGQVGLSKAVFRQGGFRSAEVYLRVECGDAVVAEAFATLRCVDAAVYGRLRRNGRPSGLADHPGPCGVLVDPAVVGRRRRDEVLVCRDSGYRDRRMFRVWIDPSNQDLFDHPVDHVPGMIQIEVCRQAALASTWSELTAGRFLSGCALEFRHMVELDRPTWCRALPAGGESVAVEVFQDGDGPLTSGVVRLCRLPERTGHGRSGRVGEAVEEVRCEARVAS